MELSEYLQSNFLTREMLLSQSGIKLDRLRELQQQKCMPLCSYRIVNSTVCKSPIASAETQVEFEYYAVGYGTWLADVSSLSDPADAFQEFKRRYLQQVESLIRNELCNHSVDWLDEPSEQLANEWDHFLAGTYGVCTRNGLPEKIATKELAAARITEILSTIEAEPDLRGELQVVVDLMDSACAEFAPHERSGSSRKRLIDDVRMRYQFETTTPQFAN